MTKASNEQCDFLPGNGVWHILTSWVMCVFQMKWIDKTGTELLIRHGKNSTLRIKDFVQDCSISSVLAMEILKSCNKS